MNVEIVTTRPLISRYAAVFPVTKSRAFRKNGGGEGEGEGGGDIMTRESTEREFDITFRTPRISPRRYLFRAYIIRVIFGGHALAPRWRAAVKISLVFINVIIRFIR